jgi:hypothetical protein
MSNHSKSSLRTLRRNRWMSSSKQLVSIAPQTLRKLVGYQRLVRRSLQSFFKSLATWMMRNHLTASFQCNAVRRKVLSKTRLIPSLSMIFSLTRTHNTWQAFSQLVILEEEVSWKAKSMPLLLHSRNSLTRGGTRRKRWASHLSKMESSQARRKPKRRKCLQ